MKRRVVEELKWWVKALAVNTALLFTGLALARILILVVTGR